MSLFPKGMQRYILFISTQIFFLNIFIFFFFPVTPVHKRTGGGRGYVRNLPLRSIPPTALRLRAPPVHEATGGHGFPDTIPSLLPHLSLLLLASSPVTSDGDLREDYSYIFIIFVRWNRAVFLFGLELWLL